MAACGLHDLAHQEVDYGCLAALVLLHLLRVVLNHLRDNPGGVALLVINLNRTASQSLELATAAERYTLSAKDLLDTAVQMNGNELTLGADDAIPHLAGELTNSDICAGNYHIPGNPDGGEQ